MDHSRAESETRLGTHNSRLVTLRRLPRLVQSFEPLHDQRQIPLFTASAFKGVDELAGLELALLKTLRPYRSDLSIHQLAKYLADRAVAGGGTEVGPHVVGDLDPRNTISAFDPRGRLSCRLGTTAVAATPGHRGFGEAYTCGRRITDSSACPLLRFS